jgi:uncharacterized RDD family membrane protein YckC
MPKNTGRQKMDSSFITLLNQSRSNYTRGNIEQALTLLKKLLEISRNDKEAQAITYFEIGKIYTDINKDDNAVKFFQKAISINPEILIQEFEWFQGLRLKNKSHIYLELERTQAEFKEYLMAQTKDCEMKQQKSGAGSYGNNVKNASATGGKSGYAQDSSVYNADAIKFAGFWKRVVATIVDGLAILFVNLISFVILVYGFGVTFSAFSVPVAEDGASITMIAGRFVGYFVWYFVSVIVWWLYYAIMESSQCRGTLGKMLLGIYVTDEYGKRIGIGRASGRYFLKTLLFAVPVLNIVDCLMVAVTQKKQAWHDMPVGCLVLSK